MNQEYIGKSTGFLLYVSCQNEKTINLTKHLTF